MSSFADIQSEVAHEIQELTINTIHNLTNVWTETFEPNVCEENLKKLSEHVAIFYSEVMLETTQRQDTVRAEIEKLQEERLNLCRLLHIDLPFPSQEGVPLYTVQMKLDESLASLRDMLKKRRDQIYELLLEQEALCEELGEVPRALLDDPLPSEETLQDFRLHLDSLKAMKVNRLYEMSTLRRDIKNFLTELELNVQCETEKNLLNDRCLPLTENNIRRLRQMHDEYCKQLEEVREAIDSMKKKLVVLWNCLETSPSIRSKFAKYTDYSQTTYDKLYRELDRCETQKRQNIKIFVDKIREEIVHWWDKTLKSDIERSRFSNFTNDCYTEDLLTLHEMELEDLKRFYTNNEKIFELIYERRILWDRMVALEAKSSEPGRYNNRGGQLLKEEKERRTIATKLPKIEAQLLELVHEFEQTQNRKFLVFGENIVEVIERDWEKKRVEKEKIMSARKNAIGTPLSRTLLRTPLSCKNHTASAKKIASHTNLSSMPSSSKRKLPLSENIPPNAKRSLLNELASPMPKFKIPGKSPMKKLRVISTTIRRKSGRQSGNARNKRRSNRTPKKLPKIIISSENSVTSDTMCYEMFEEHLESDPKCRSSIVCGEISEPKKSTRVMSRRQQNVQTPRIGRTPKRTILEQASLRKSPALSRTQSPLAGPSSRKLTTKNLPIII